jgi:branched-chain amino acid transport system substrate-binding protein
MKALRLFAAVALACGMAAEAPSQELRIGFLNTTSGTLAIPGAHLERGWKLGLEKEGWTKDGDALGGVPTRIVYADDQAKPDVGLREVERMMKGDRIQILAGVLASNVMMAVAKLAFDAKVLVLSANAGPTPLAGPLCNPLFVSTAFVNDQNAEATGELMSREGIKSAYVLAPNYQAGKDNVAGFQRTYKGTVAGQILFKLGETDFQADFSKVRAAAPEAVFVFAPGAMGISFLKQWSSSGLAASIKLYTLYTIDNATLPAIGLAAIGSVQTGHWNPDLDNPRNAAFIRAYVSKFNHLPSMYAVHGYDAAGLIAAAVKATGGKVDDTHALAATMRKGGLASIRGDLTYNANGFLIQPYWKIEIVPGPEGAARKQGRGIVFERRDSYWEQCPAAMRH